MLAIEEFLVWKGKSKISNRMEFCRRFKIFAHRLFFACMFLMVVFLSAYFISNVWNKWNASPLIVTLDAYGTSVTDLPFPGIWIESSYNFDDFSHSFISLRFRIAVTICNMNQVQKSAVSRLSQASEEYSVVQSICRYATDTNAMNSVDGNWSMFRKVLLDVRSFNFVISSFSHEAFFFLC